MNWLFDNWLITLPILIAAGIAGAISRKLIRRWRTYEELLRPVLEEHGLMFIHSKTPKLFDVGPFPFVVSEFGRPQSNVPFVGRGEFVEYRIVTVTDSNGEKHEVWARLDFEVFHLRRIEWKPELEQFSANT